MFNQLKKTSFGLAFVLTTTTASAFSLDGTVYEKIGNETNLNPYLLYSISLAESALAADGKKGFMAPNPFVIRTLSKGHHFDSLEEAASFMAKMSEKQKSTMDVGLLQINMKWHPHPNPEQLLNPEDNLRAGAKILKAALASTDDQILGVGRYHSWTPERAIPYGLRINEIWARLLKKANKDPSVAQPHDNKSEHFDIEVAEQ